MSPSGASTTASTRFSQYEVVLAPEPASLWWENVVAVVTLLRVLARMSKWGKQVIKCRSLIIILLSGEGVTSFTKKVTVLTFLVKNGKMKLSRESTF